MSPLPNQHELQPSVGSRWPHRLAIALALITFPLIWVGGLVTTYDAGMAVPDWPRTFGYNPFAYPLETWWKGPRGLFIEHGHRMLALAAVMLTILLVGAAWKTNAAKSTKYLTLSALLLVVVQAVLGGMRVLFDDRMLAKIHACVGPAFFCLAVAIAVVTSRRWLPGTVPEPDKRTGGIQRLALVTVILAYFQLLLGAQVRHISVFASSQSYQVWLLFHLFVAIVLVGHVAFLFGRSLRKSIMPRQLRFATWLLSLLIVVQIGLGLSTWIFKFGWPAWMGDYHFAASFTIVAEGFAPSIVTTAHVATGSLILATSLVVGMMSLRFLKRTAVVAALSATPLVGAIA